jgi:hypothetical protein
VLTLTAAGEDVREAVVWAMRAPPDVIAALPDDDQRAPRAILGRALERHQVQRSSSGATSMSAAATSTHS